MEITSDYSSKKVHRISNKTKRQNKTKLHLLEDQKAPRQTVATYLENKHKEEEPHKSQSVGRSSPLSTKRSRRIAFKDETGKENKLVQIYVYEREESFDKEKMRKAFKKQNEFSENKNGLKPNGKNKKDTEKEQTQCQACIVF